MTRPRIFVHAPAYRDREMQWTLRDMFEQAAHPERVFAGICWQTVPEEDADCFVIRPRPAQLREHHVHAAKAQGLGWARARAGALWEGEEYSLQIDSHMRFAPGWDERVLAMLAACDAPDPVLTHYPAGYTPPDTRRPYDRPRVQVVKGFLPDGMLQFTTAPVPEGVPLDRPFPTAACAGGFIFGPSRILRDVPADPEIYFNGEEPNLAVRLWTHGFDLHSPNETVIFHYYGRHDGSRHWNDQPSSAVRALHDRTLRRMRALCNPAAAPAEEVAALGPHGLGARRSLAEYEAYAGVSFAGRSVAEQARHHPWVRPPDRRAALALAELGRAPGAELFVLGDAGVLCSEDGRIQRANEGATHVWCALEAGRDWAAIASGLAAARDVPVARVEAELRELADHWLGAGLLRRTGEVAMPGPAAPRLDPVRHDLRTHHLRLLDTRVRLRVGGPALEGLLLPPLAHLAAPTGPAGHCFDLVSMAGWHYLFADDRLLHHGRDPAALLPLLKSALLTRAVARQDHLLHLHAAAVRIGKALVLLPGRSGSGKTLLTARLLHAGASYFSDETVLLAPEDAAVRPVPTSLSVKAAGADRLAPLFPGLHALPEHQREDGIAVRYMPPPAGSVAPDRPALPSLCVFPRYQAGAPTALRRLLPADAFARLLDEAIAVPRTLGPPAVATLVAAVERMPCWELTGGDLDGAAAAVMARAAGLAGPAAHPEAA